jgi:orotate phosphoribosyltransferase
MATPNILEMGERKLHRLKVSDINRQLTPEEFTYIFKAHETLWLHSGNPEHPHAELTSGKCSNGFVNVLKALKHTNLCLIFADQLIRTLVAHDPNFLEKSRRPHWVIGSDHASANLSFAVAAQLNAQHDFTEKKKVDGEEQQIWNRFQIARDARILQVEELVTTLKTLRSVRQGVREGNEEPITFLPYTITVVHRSAETVFEGDPILYLVHYDIETWDSPDVCPLCKAGSERIRPKGAANWARLTQPAD